MRSNRSRFVVFLACKPYVKAYLVRQFNDPDKNWPVIVNLSSDKELKRVFVDSLVKPVRFNTKYENLYKYPENVPIEISKDVFYRYGWALTKAATIAFNKIIERHIKRQLFTYLEYNMMLGVPMSVAIRNFRNAYGFEEEVWKYDTIRREYNRHRRKMGLQPDGNTIYDFIHRKIFGEVVPNMGHVDIRPEYEDI